MTERRYDAHGYYDRAGRPISERDWMVKFGSQEYKVVGWWSNRGGNKLANREAELIVSTIWLGLNHGWGHNALQIFETMIFGGEYDQDRARYATEAQALEGHRRTVEDVQAGRVPWFAQSMDAL